MLHTSDLFWELPCVSWDFIGTSSPAGTVEGARRSTLITSQAAWPAVAAGFGLRAAKRRQARYKQGGGGGAAAGRALG
jgi:hypothetical protein